MTHFFADAPCRGPRPPRPLVVAALLLSNAPAALADHGGGRPARQDARRRHPSAAANRPSLPTQIPATMEGITREQIEQTINASDRRRRAEVTSRVCSCAKRYNRRLQPRDPVEPRLGHRQRRAPRPFYLPTASLAVELPRQRGRGP